MNDSSKECLNVQPNEMIFALDIGTRSVIGIAGMVESGKFRVIAMEKEEHTQRSMIDGQIEDIEQVASVALIVKNRLETKLRYKLKRVCVAAAGRALRTQRASFEMEFPKPQRVDTETISRLEAAAIGEAETAFTNELDADSRQFYLVGHTTVRYYMDGYAISSLVDHQARRIKADVIATFLPSEVVESLYSAMSRIGLEVASLTLEPIAAINAAIPEKFRLLNLALVDIGAGTSDIAVCRDGGIVGYTMVTVAGDEITEALMKKYLFDFDTAELVKTRLGTQDSICVTDILGNEQTITQDDMWGCTDETTTNLCREISEHICEVNGAPTSAVFLAGGGSKLKSIRTGIAKYMNIDLNRVALAGNNFQIYAFSDTCDFNDPEYATPLGIAISAGLNLITESRNVTINGSRARLFRDGVMTVSDVLMMNGFSYRDFLPRAGEKLNIEVNGNQVIYYGTPGEAAVLRLNGREAKISDLVKSGDSIEFTPASQGQPARYDLKNLLADSKSKTAIVNGKIVSPDTPLKTGDTIITESDLRIPDADSQFPVEETVREEAPRSLALDAYSEPSTPVEEPVTAAPSLSEPAVSDHPDNSIELILNNKPIVLSKKDDGSPYYLMDMLELSGIDLEHPAGEVVLRVNGADGSFLQDLKSGDRLEIYFAPVRARQSN